MIVVTAPDGGIPTVHAITGPHGAARMCGDMFYMKIRLTTKGQPNLPRKQKLVTARQTWLGKVGSGRKSLRGIETMHHARVFSTLQQKKHKGPNVGAGQKGALDKSHERKGEACGDGVCMFSPGIVVEWHPSLATGSWGRPCPPNTRAA